MYSYKQAHKWLHRAGFGVRNIIVPDLLAITENCIQYFLHSGYIEQFAKFFYRHGLWWNVFKCSLPVLTSIECSKIWTKHDSVWMTVHGAGSGRGLWYCYIAFTRMFYVKNIVQPPIVSLIINFVLLFSHCYRVFIQGSFPRAYSSLHSSPQDQYHIRGTNALARGSWFAWLSPHENKGRAVIRHLFCF